MAESFKDTLQLPKTGFPMRAELPQREPVRLAHWEETGLYEALQRKRASAGKAFVLHDGPPFTNGDLHVGHALNKTLKDLINRYKSMRGYRVPYVPGWDCHGLPIEQKVSREFQEAGKTASTSELRARCDAFSEGWIDKQTAQFKRLGVMGDWNNAYKTKDPAYEADIVRTFATFVDRGLVYRSKKPVYWSIPFETALAEAEIEYKDHVSPSVWVKFPVPPKEAEKFGLPSDKPLSVVIWTTTPWTLPANLAIALHPEAEYAVADIGNERLLAAEALIPSVAQAAGLASPPEIIHRAKGSAFEGLAARHPFIDRASPIVLADYVTTDSGTGCVHTAPGHGAEDYLTGLRYKLEIYCPVGDDGRFLDDGRMPADLVGLTTLESVEDLAAKRTSPANVGVLKKLAGLGALLAKKNFTHSYPHCWRSKTPIIFRALDQWFVRLDGPDGPRGPALEAVAAIGAGHGWIPAWGEARMRGAVESRPDWCISRQRAWGVPIPAFYGADKRAYLDAGVARAVAGKFEQQGTNLWYEAPAWKILEGIRLPAGWPPAADLACGRDTLDVWIDSGSSHAAVLKRERGGTRWPADLYLEGSDQHRGWFQSSLWTSVVGFGTAPYRAVLTHGFIVDEDRKKLSKSDTYAKPQTSDAYVKEYGADVLRLWISSQDFRNDIPISKEILSHVGETYRLFRNTFRFQLANLSDFDPAAHAVPVAQMDMLDRWALHQAAALVRECAAAYDGWEFHRVYQLCNHFCVVTLSATYHDILKDRLYTLGANAFLRRSSQTAIAGIFEVLVKVLAPILVFTADEAWSFRVAGTEYSSRSAHLEDWPDPPASWTDAAVADDMASLLKARARVNETIEPLRAAGKLGKSLDASVTLAGSPGDGAFSVLEKYRDFLPELFIVSAVRLRPVAAEGAEPSIDVVPCADEGTCRCARCWRWVPSVEHLPLGDVCPRCVEALKNMG